MVKDRAFLPTRVSGEINKHAIIAILDLAEPYQTSYTVERLNGGRDGRITIVLSKTPLFESEIASTLANDIINRGFALDIQVEVHGNSVIVNL